MRLHKIPRRRGVRNDEVAAQPEPEVQAATGSRRRRATRWRPNNRDCWPHWKTRFLRHSVLMTWPSIIVTDLLSYYIINIVDN